MARLLDSLMMYWGCLPVQRRLVRKEGLLTTRAGTGGTFGSPEFLQDAHAGDYRALARLEKGRLRLRMIPALLPWSSRKRDHPQHRARQDQDCLVAF